MGIKDYFIGGKSFDGHDIQGKTLNTFYRVTVTVKNANSLLYLDQKLIAEKKVEKYVLVSGGIWMLGQDQDALGGGFDTKQRLIGSICNFRMWNSGLNKTEVAEFFKNPKTMTAQPVFDNPPTYRYEKNSGAY